VAVALKLMERDLAAGPEEFKKRRYLGRFEEYTYGWSDDPRIKPLHAELCAVAEQLEGLSHAQPEEQRQYTLRVEARLLNAAAEFPKTIPVIKESIRLLNRTSPEKPERLEPGASARGEVEMLILADAYEGLREYQNSIPLFQAFLAKTPERRYLMGRLAKAYRANGQEDLGRQWEFKADPGKGLVGQTAPDFSLKTPAGEAIRLQEILHGHKAVLVNFWFYGCHPCRVEFPQLEKIYEKLHGAGFDLVAINQGDPAGRISDYVKENHFSFRVAMNGSGQQDIGNRYKVQAYPTNFLLDGTGKILWRSEGFDEEGLRGALAKLGLRLD
jgi:thiol-disulfide isomerase/thioredoxin